MTQPEKSRPLQDQIVTVLGGSGFLGRHLAQELLARGARLRVASRHPMRAFSLKPLGDLGQVQFVACDVTRPETLAAALAGSDMAVNLTGAFKGNLDAIQREGAGRIAAAAKAAGATALVHVSALGADAGSDVAYARTKAQGERAVLAAFPGATILRPSILFGPDDTFITMFARAIATFPALPVFGPHVKLQPVFVDDAAKAVANALAAPAAHGGRTYDIAGPEVLTMLELNERIAIAQRRKRLFVPLPDGVSSAIATLTGWAPGAPITRSQWKLLRKGSVAAAGMEDMRALGVSPRPLDLFLDRWMVTYRRQGRFHVAAT